MMLQDQAYQKAKRRVDELLQVNPQNISLRIRSAIQDFSIGNLGLAYICTFDDVNTLCLNYGNINSQGLRYLSGTRWKNLTAVNLSLNAIGNRGCKLITNVSWGSLEKLYLCQCKIEDAGACHISKGAFPRLLILDIAQNRISVIGVQQLKHGQWKKMQSLNIYNLIKGANKKNSIISPDSLLQLLLCDWPEVVIRNMKQNKNRIDAVFAINERSRAQFSKKLIQKFPKSQHEWEQRQNLALRDLMIL